MKIFNKLQYIIMYILGLVIIGISSLITGDIGLEALNDPIYYVKQLLVYVAIICVTIATVMKIVDDFKTKDEEYINSDKEIKNFAENFYIPSIFTRFLDFINNKRKIAQHKFIVTKKLHKLETKTELKEALFNKKYKKTSYFKRARYTNQKALLESQLGDDFIQNELPYRLVKYDRISSSIIIGGIFTKNENTSPNEFITKNTNAKIIKDKIPSLLLSFAITSIVGALVIDFKFDASSLLDIIVKLGTLLWNVFISIRYGNDYTQTVVLRDIRFRKGIVNEYKKWLNQEANKKEQNITRIREDELPITHENKDNLLTQGS